MKWFGRKAGRESARPFLYRGMGPPAFALPAVPRSYEAQVRDAYFANPVAQRAVRLVAEGVGEGPFTTSHDAALALVEASSGGQALLETLASQLLLHGNAFVHVLQDARGAAAELFALRPERVTIEADARGWPTAFGYRAGEVRQRIAASDPLGRPGIIHLKAPNPLDDHYGLGCLGAAAGAVAIHNAATRWNAGLLENAARPSGALVYDAADGAELSNDQYERLRTELEISYQGSRNAGRPMLLEGGLKWQALALTPAEMDFAGLKAAAARDIALAFGVPPMLIGLPGDATYANYKEANRALWRLTILPLAGKILGGIAEGLRSWWPGLTLAVDQDQLSVLAEDRERLWRQVSGADFLAPEEKRAMLGIRR